MAGLASRSLRVGLFAALLFAVSGEFGLAQEKVGVNSAVNPEATGTPPGAAPRRLVIGQDVVFNEHITTAAEGQTQLLFLDQSSMTIGPNSDLAIDQFVYDPRSGTGKLAMSATRGVLRYIGGKLSKQDNAVTLRTSTATLAVRGGAFIANVDANGRTQVIFIFGDGLTVTGLNGVSETVRRPGFQITVNPGAAPSAPAPTPPTQLAQLVQQLDGRSGGTGGATIIPTDTTVAASGITQTVSGNLTTSVQQAIQNQPTTTTTTPTAGTTATTNTILNSPTIQNSATGGQVIDCVSAGTCPPQTIQTVSTSGGTSGGTTGGSTAGGGTTGSTPVTVTYAGRIKKTNDTTRGFFDQTSNIGPTTNGDVPYPATIGGAVYSNGTLSFPQGSPQSGTFTGSFGSLGTLTFPLVPGFSTTQGSSSALGTFSASTFLSADNTYFYANITPASQPSNRLLVFGGTPVNAGFYQPTGSTRVFAFTVQPDAALQSNMPFVRSQAGGNLPNAIVSPFYLVAPATSAIGDTSTNAGARGLQASLVINGQGENQQSAIAVTAGTIGTQNGQPVFTGSLRGSSLLSATSGTPVAIGSAVATTVDGNGNSFYGSNGISGYVVNQTGLASETPLSGSAATYGFAQPALPTTLPSGVPASRTTQAMAGSFGGLMYTTAQTNPYIVTGSTLVSTDASANRVQATFNGSAQSTAAGLSNVTMQYGSLSGTPGAQAFIDDNNFAAMESQVNAQQATINGGSTQPTGQLYMVTSGAAGVPTALFQQAGVTPCACQFLQWGYWGGDLDTVDSTGATRIDRGNINTWVAGVPTPLNDLNSLISQSATANYAGQAIGSVSNNGANYMAAGGFNGTYNFGTQTGSVTLKNFDIFPQITASGSAPLSGANYTFGVNSGGVSGKVNGTFYGPMAAETGGNFALQAPALNYLASGIFAGKKQ